MLLLRLTSLRLMMTTAERQGNGMTWENDAFSRLWEFDIRCFDLSPKKDVQKQYFHQIRPSILQVLIEICLN